MIWTYSDCNGKNTDDVNLAQYKLTGKFYADCEALWKLMNIKVHPALRPVLWEKEKPLFEQEDTKVEEKEVEVVKFDKHRIDKNSMKVLFHCLPVSQVKTLKFWNNGISPSQFDSIVDHLHNVPNIQTVFFDWNPLYKENFRTLPKGEDPIYTRADDEPSRFVKFVNHDSKIKILFLRGNQLKDSDVKQMCDALKENHLLKVIDISYNNITSKSVTYFKELTDLNKSLEFIGLAKNNLTIEDVQPLLDCIGKTPFPEEDADAHIKKMKERDAIIEKNKKLKASKKPEEPVPLIDDIEQLDDGSWVMVKNGQLRHINLCMNPIGNDSKQVILDLLKRTPTEFSITLSGTQMTKDVIEEIQSELNTPEQSDLGKQRLLF